MSLRFFVTPRGRGYWDLHKSHSYLLDRAAQGSRVWMLVTDDVVFCHNGWDKDVFNLIDRETVFIAGSRPKDRVTKLNPPHPADPTGRRSYESEDFPILSWNLLDILRSASPDVEGWTLLGDRFCIDTYVSSIIHIVNQNHGKDIYHHLEKYCDRHFTKFSWTQNPERAAIRSEALGHFFEPSSVEIRAGMVEKIYQAGLLDKLPEALEPVE